MTLEEKGDRFYGMLAYSLGWLSAIYVMRAERRSVRWHARQSMIVFGGLTMALIVADAILPQGSGYWAQGSGLTRLTREIVMGGLLLASVGLWVALPLMTLLGRPFLVPIFAPLTLKMAGPPPWTLPTEAWQLGASAQQQGSRGGWDDPLSGGSMARCNVCGGSGRMTCPRCLGACYERGGLNEQACSYCLRSGSVQCTGPGPH
jgi:uncharacterized membrane protein